MKVFLSALEASPEFYYINSKIDNYKYNLMSFYYIKKEEVFKEIIKKSELILIDSGAHSFQKGKKVDWVEYTKKYANWIKENDCDKILGYFEMDVDNVIGYESVLELRKILESVTDKIIPVWHKNRGIEDFKKMCKDYQGKIIAITGFKNEDIQDHQYMMFLKYAKKYNCKVHCLGMTRRKILDTVPFDFVDSSSWKQQAIYGRVGKHKVTKEYSKKNRKNVMLHCYLDGMKMQEHYYKKWKPLHND
jgi:hypothetical protein